MLMPGCTLANARQAAGLRNASRARSSAGRAGSATAAAIAFETRGDACAGGATWASEPINSPAVTRSSKRFIVAISRGGFFLGRIMSLLRGLVDRLLLICAAVAGGLVPGFMSQYRQRLGGMLDQARRDLAPWQKIADQYYHGDLSQLIQYHLASKDPTFHAEGAAISSLVASVQHLQIEVAALHGSLFQQAAYLALHADPAIARVTLGDWVPTFGLSADGILFALLFAF